MWQKARILSDDLFPHLIGKYIWVKEGPPELVEARHPLGYSYDSIMVEDNLQPIRDDVDGHGYELDELELQGDFSEAVGKVPREVWQNPGWAGC